MLHVNVYLVRTFYVGGVRLDFLLPSQHRLERGVRLNLREHARAAPSSGEVEHNTTEITFRCTWRIRIM